MGSGRGHWSSGGEDGGGGVGSTGAGRIFGVGCCSIDSRFDLDNRSDLDNKFDLIWFDLIWITNRINKEDNK